MDSSKEKQYRMTRYELIRVLSSRAEQIATGSPLCTAVVEGDHPMSIAIRELEEGVLPLKLEREFPDGSSMMIRLADMIVPHKTFQHIKTLVLIKPWSPPLQV